MEHSITVARDALRRLGKMQDYSCEDLGDADGT